MRSALYLSSALLAWSHLAFALPLPSCLQLEPLLEDGATPCEPVELPYDWALEEGRPRRKARSAEGLANANAIPVLKLRENTARNALSGPAASVRRAAERAFSKLGKEGPMADSRTVRTLKKRWSIFHNNILESVAGPEVQGAADTDATSKKRWEIPEHGDVIELLALDPDGSSDSDSAPTEPSDGS